MVDTLTEEANLERGVMEIILDPRIMEPDSQAAPVEELEVFLVNY